MVIEVIGGLVSGSLTLLADAAHMATDAAALGLALWAGWLARRQARDRLAYGYSRVPLLAAFVNALLLLPLCGWMMWEAYHRALDPVDILAVPMMAVAVIGLLVNIAAFRLLHRDADGNVNVRGAMLHVIGDMLGSAAAIIAAAVIWFTHWTLVDPLLSVLVALIVLRSAWGLLRETAQSLLGLAPSELTEERIRTAILNSTAPVQDVHHIHIWRTALGAPLIALHARLSADADEAVALDRIRRLLAEDFGISHATIQIERQDFTCTAAVAQA